MPLTDAGRIRIAALLAGEAVEPFDFANAHVGVGNSAAAFAEDQTDLQGVTSTRVAVDSVERTGDVLTFVATFGEDVGEHAWAEVGVFDDPAAGTMLVREVIDLGTKAAGVTVLTVPVDLMSA